MGNKIKIIVAEDHEMYRKGMAEILKSIDTVELVDEACDGNELLNIVNKIPVTENQNPVDIIFMDIKMPNMSGIDATREILRKYPSIKVITLTMFGDEKFLQNMIDAGAKGFLLKNTTSKEIKSAISNVMKGSTYFSVKFLSSAFSNAYKNKIADDEPEKIKITDTEHKIIQYIAKGLSFEEIGKILNVKFNTVKNFVYPIYKKTSSKNKTELIIYALRNRLIEMEDLDIKNEELILETFSF
ncbi:MAG: response regulator transcription factor [Bacteroidales bacterium]|nr:response regulator transcription factor [Bacteroidales bacterium]